MQQREKILAGGLGTVLVLWLGLPMFESRFLKPLTDLKNRKLSLQDEVNRVFDEQIDLAKKDAEMKQWRLQSLPPDPLDAQRLYQEWLINLAQLCGFEQIKVTLERRAVDSDTFVTIPVTLECQATLQELARFLQQFESVDLLQRLSRCDIVSPSSAGDPQLAITLTAEGLSLQSAPDRPRLFAQTELFEPLSEDGRQLTVVSNSQFPEKAPFRIRLGNEFLRVTAIDGNNWSVQRGVEKTFSQPHAANTPVELFPIRQPDAVSDDAVAALWRQSPFTKPAPLVDYQPHLAAETPPPAIRGRQWTWKLNIEDWNPAFGSPNFELLNGPDGLDLDERSGALKWDVGDQVELGEHPLQVLVWGTNGKNAGFTPTVALHVRDPNLPPKVAQSEPLRFFIGRESRIPIPATDPDGESSRLTYELSEAPEGMTISTNDGQLRWTPPLTLAPQEFNITVKVTDADPLPESTTVQLPVKLAEDSARFAYLTGSVQRTSGEREAWIYDRVTNQTTVIHTGDRFRIADFDLIVEQINPTSVLLRRDGQLYRLAFEQAVVEMVPVAPASSTPQ